MNTVQRCYEILDLCFLGGVEDLTEGIYNKDGGYEDAQKAKAEQALNEIGCREGSKILDIGCGYGRILKAAEQRKAKAVGITISSLQKKRCKQSGLDVHLMNYKDIPKHWYGSFDGIVIYGAIEHFVQLEDISKQDDIYKNLFELCAKLLKPQGRMFTSTIHFPQQSETLPKKMKTIFRNFGGYYPQRGQLEQNAQDSFRQVKEVDGTRDYYLSSEHWLKELRKKLRTSPRVWRGIGKTLFQHPMALISMLHCFLISKSWNWQFEGSAPPMVLLRKTWEKL